LGQDSISQLGWSGEIFDSKDFVAPVEANVGETDSNIYITRDYKLGITNSSGFINHNLVITLNNSASPAFGEGGIYKVYVGIVIPKDSQFLGAKEITPRGEQSLQVDGNLGVYEEVLPGRVRKIGYSWRSVDETNGDYEIYVHKQAGTLKDSFTLTLNGNTVYNSTLDKDIWIKQP